MRENDIERYKIERVSFKISHMQKILLHHIFILLSSNIKFVHLLFTNYFAYKTYLQKQTLGELTKAHFYTFFFLQPTILFYFILC